MAWFVVQSKRWQEQRVEAHLSRMDIESYLPFIEVRRRNRTKSVQPLFPGYLFVRFAYTPRAFHAVRWTPGVRRVLGTQEGPTPVHERVIAAIRERADATAVVRPGPTLDAGERVAITEGPLAGLTGILERPASGAQRVRVLIDLLGAHVELDGHMLEAD